ncbi:MAG: hypothetical protein ACP5HQ_05365 [Thermoprotei archaeon]
MSLLLKLAGELSYLVVSHYGRRVKGVAISGDLGNDLGRAFVIAVFENFEKVSFYSRGELNVYFLKKLSLTDNYRKYVSTYGRAPSIHLLPIDVKETRYGIPFVANLLLRARIVYDPQGHLKKSAEYFSKHLTPTNYGFSMGIKRRGEVKEV